MNKIYITLALMLAVFSMNAQNFKTGPSIPVSSEKATTLKKGLKQQHKGTKTLSSRWYDYANTIDEELSNLGKLYMDYLFPDTNIVAKYGSTYDTPWIHTIATIIDPKNSNFAKSGKQLITENDGFYLDSVNINLSYVRNTADSIHDTLVFEFFATNDHSNFPEYFFKGMSDNYFTDTLFFKGIKRSGLSLLSTSKKVVKYVLTKTDTISDSFGWNNISVAVPGGVQATPGEVVGVTVTFIPGYSYSALDTMNNNNFVIVASIEENGEDTYPSYTPGDWNTSQIIPSWATKAGSSWLDIFVPEWAFVKGYGFENHLIQFLLTSDAGFSGIESSVNNGLSVSQNMPNPFSGNSTINYSLNEKSDVSFEVFNVTGSKVMELNEGVKTAGNHSIQIDASTLNAGVYYYSVIAGDKRITKKMIVY